jgi:hypothetical protein
MLVSFLPQEEISHAEHGVRRRVVDLGEVRRPLPLQHVLVLGLRPRVEPQDFVLHDARVRRRARPAVLVHRGAERRRLGDELAGTGAVEAPAVVHALEPALAVDALARGGAGRRRRTRTTRRRRGCTRRRRGGRAPSCRAARAGPGRTRGQSGTTGPASRTRPSRLTALPR